VGSSTLARVQVLRAILFAAAVSLL
jgi:hypothetical protein